MTRNRLAHFLSDLFSPWLVNAGFFLILGLHTGSWPSAIVAALGTGPAIRVVILWKMRSGSVSNHHVTNRQQRGPLFVIITVIVLTLLAVLAILPTPHLIWAGMGSALVFLIGFGLVTMVGKIKASIHVGLWACLVTFLGLTVSPWWCVGYLVTPVIAWSRMVIKHHTLTEVIAGIATGAVVTSLAVWFFL